MATKRAAEVSVCAATPSDWERTRALRLRALAGAPEAFGSTLVRERGQPEPFWRDRLERAIATLIAAVDGRDAGLAVVADSWDRAEDAALYGMWVEPWARGRGVGEALVEACVAAARGAGRARLVLEVADGNAAAAALYARMGFAATGRTRTLDPPREHLTEHERAREL